MRLLHTRSYMFSDDEAILSNMPPTRTKYAALSHRWTDTEVTFVSMNAQKLADETIRGPQREKIRGACRQARRQGLDWIWIDSCCIDKSSSEELTKSIRSMFQWYNKAEICYAYLSDVTANYGEAWETFNTETGSPSVWFTRGWTLQELLAPRDNMIFFDNQWQALGTKYDLAPVIERITGIHTQYLRGQDFRTASIAARLGWQANRQTTKPEDMAYSLFGILDVSLVPIYGEGHQAFVRLQEELLNKNPDESLFAWTIPSGGLPLPLHNQSTSGEEMNGAYSRHFHSALRAHIISPSVLKFVKDHQAES